MLLLFWILGQIAAFAFFLFYDKKNDPVKALVLSQGIYYSVYVIFAGLFIWMQVFSIFIAVLFSFIFLFCGFLFSLFFLRKDRKEKATWMKRPLIMLSYIPLILILLGAFFLTKTKAGFHSMSQDQGAYQARALLYMNDYNANALAFPEVKNLIQDFEKEEYYDKIDHLSGFYLLNDAEANKAKQIPVGVFHGIPTFSTLLALWGKIFGLTGMTGILSLLFMISTGCVFLALKQFKVKLWVSSVLSALFMFSPVLLWSGKQSLTEILLIMFISVFLCLFMDENEDKSILLSVLPLIAYAFTHIITSSLLPMFAGVYFLGYLGTKKKVYLQSLIYFLLFYVCGFWMMKSVALWYFESQFSLIFNATKYKINRDNLPVIVTIVVSVIVLFIFFLLLRKGNKKPIIRLKKKSLLVFLGAVTGIILIALMISIFKTTKVGLEVTQVTMFHYITCCGYFVFPMSLLGLWIYGSRKEGNMLLPAYAFLMLYSLAVYSVIIYPAVYKYYYFARYFIIVYPLIFMLAGFTLNKCKVYLGIPLSIIAVILMIVQNPLLYKAKDNTYATFENLETLYSVIEEDMAYSSVLPEDSAIMIFDSDYDENMLMTMALKAKFGQDIFFYDQNIADYKIAEMSLCYKQVYLVALAYSSFTDPDKNGGKWDILDEVPFELSYYVNMEKPNALFMPVVYDEGKSDYLIMKHVFE